MPNMGKLRGFRRTSTFGRAWATLSALFLGSAGYLGSLSSAQTTTVCGVAQTTPIRVENATGVGELRAAVRCTEGGAVEADWAGNVTLLEPIAVGEGTFLSVTGEGDLAEVHADGSQTNNGTRLFEVSEGGGLILTQLKLSGGTAAEGGGAIYSYFANVTLDNCTFEGNVATEGNGGAVWAEGGNVTIIGGEFLHNTAPGYGGAVYAVEGRLVVKGVSRFERNEAVVGGGLFCGLGGGVGASKPLVICSIIDAEFVSNSDVRDNNDNVEDFSYYDGGGAAAFMFAIVDITDSVFDGNTARLAGGALHGGAQSTLTVNGCTFVDNTSEKFGGAITASSMTLGGSTQFMDNEAWEDGGAVYGWDTTGTITFNDVACSENVATYDGGCVYGAGSNIFNDGVVMLDNQAESGGCIFAHEGSNVTVNGGEYTCEAGSLGGFLFAEGDTNVKIAAGHIEENLAGVRGGAIYCDGAGGSSDISIEGGVFRRNRALSSGGAISLWGAGVVARISGGTFENNNATLQGGFAFVDEGASITCEGAAITGSSAGDHGGGIYAQKASWVNSSCDLISNDAPQAAAIYLTNVESATFDTHYVTDNLASGGSVVYVISSSVVVKDVRFTASDEIQDYSFNRAVQLGGDSTLDAEGCVFDGWRGDTVIFSTSSTNGSLVLDSCDFSSSSPVMAVVSPNSDAEIRNAIVSSSTFDKADLNTSLSLVDRALGCSDPSACGAGACEDSTLGVLCECLEGGECLHDGGVLSLSLKRPAVLTFDPDLVSYDLVISSSFDGTTDAIWKLEFEGGGLELDVIPSSGILSPGRSIVVSVTGTAMNQDVGGDLTSSFSLMSVGSRTTDSTDDIKLEVLSTFYHCREFEYALDDDDSGISCEQCASIEGSEGVDCASPGATLASLPIRRGYWRTNSESIVVQKCLHSDACVGADEVSSSDDYCGDGYKGPYCAVCAESYGRSLSNTCHPCSGAMARLLIVACTVFFVLTILLLSLTAVFLIGGLDGIKATRQSVIRKISTLRKASSIRRPVRETTSPERKYSGKSAILGSTDVFIAPAFDITSGVDRDGGEGNTDDGMGSTLQCSERDEPGITCPRLLDGAVGLRAGVGGSNVSGRHALSDEGPPTSRPTQLYTHAGAGKTVAKVDRGFDEVAAAGGKPRCCGLEEKIARLSVRLPLNKLKILVAVWQILAVFSSITGVEFPSSYSVFLSWINVVNFDLGYIVSASCVLPYFNFYQRLLATTLTPLIMIAGLALTYRMAKRRSGIGSFGEIARREAWSRHVTAGLFLTFLVFTSASSMVLQTYACDNNVADGESYLRADYSISCETTLHMIFKVYAGFMIVVYPIGIPALYFLVLWRRRRLLNPRIHSGDKYEGDNASDDASGADFVRRKDDPSAILLTASNGQTKTYWSPQQLKELDERVKARAEHPELTPFMFLWRDFGSNLYYYEVVECGRRILLTEVLIFIAPQSAKQAAMACIFAFVSLLAFELLRPHVDPTDSWLYRLGCVVIFMSYFLALLIKMGAAGEANRSAIGGFLVAVNVLLVLAVLCTAWFAVRRMGDSDHEERVISDEEITEPITMLTAKQSRPTTSS